MNIVAAYVPTDVGQEVLKRAIDEARHHGGRIVVLNSSRGDSSIDDRLAQGERLQSLQTQLEESGVDFEIRQPVRGRNADEEIIRVAEDVDAAMVVIGLRRRSPVGKLILGSTTQRVLLEVDCPVLAVKAPR